MKWRNGLNALIGIWFIVAPWVLGFSGRADATWTSVVIGVIQAAASIWAAYVERPGWGTWQNWVALLTGVWFVVQPFALNLSAVEGVVWSSVILGLVTVVANLWTMVEGHNEGHPVHRSRAKAS
ncbi:MAG: SPW repeat protein [Alicyclobacillus sp.]|nr:SPW repeat protein [Alicyclobacillus sp.]